MQTEMASVITAERITGAAWPELASAVILWMRMATASAITMVPARAMATGVAPGADAEMVFEVDGAGKQRERLCGANRKRSEPLNGIPIPFGGSARYI